MVVFLLVHSKTTKKNRHVDLEAFFLLVLSIWAKSLSSHTAIGVLQRKSTQTRPLAFRELIVGPAAKINSPRY